MQGRRFLPPLKGVGFRGEEICEIRPIPWSGNLVDRLGSVFGGVGVVLGKVAEDLGSVGEAPE